MEAAPATLLLGLAALACCAGPRGSERQGGAGVISLPEPLDRASLAVAPHILLALTEGTFAARTASGARDAGSGYLPVSRRRATDLASLLTGLDPMAQGLLREGDPLRAATLLDVVEGYGYEVAAFPCAEEDKWVAGRRPSRGGGLVAAIDWLTGDGARPRFGLVLGSETMDALERIEDLPVRHRARSVKGSVIGWDPDGERRLAWTRGRKVLGERFGVLPPGGSQDLASSLLYEWGLPLTETIRRAMPEAPSGAVPSIRSCGIVSFTAGAAGEDHVIEVTVWSDALRVVITPEGTDPLMDWSLAGWELDGPRYQNLLAHNRCTWIGDAQSGQGFEVAIEHWYETVVLPARAQRAGAGRGSP